jgi:hypothetical protein
VTGEPQDAGPALQRRLAAAEAREAELATRLEVALDELEQRETGADRQVVEALESAAGQLASLRHRKAAAEQRATAAEAFAAAARRELAEERAWVAEQARRVAASQAWRIGHLAVRQGRRLTLRRDRGTDALSAIVQRMTADDAAAPPPPPR